MIVGLRKVLWLCLLLFASCADFKEVFDARDQPPQKPSVQESNEVKSSEASVESEVLAPDSFKNRAPIKTAEGTYYFVKSGDTLESLASQYKVSAIALAHVNDMLYESTLPVGRRIFIPKPQKLSRYVDRKLLKASIAKSTDKKKKSKTETPLVKKPQLIWPASSGVFTSGFGMRRGRHHDGIDISTPSGTPVLAAAEGEVLYSEVFAQYGKLILIKHSHGFFTAYAHNRKILVSKGQKVKQGQTIAESGNTGRSTGPHIHFEVHKRESKQGSGVKIDPLSVLPPKPSTIK